MFLNFCTKQHLSPWRIRSPTWKEKNKSNCSSRSYCIGIVLVCYFTAVLFFFYGACSPIAGYGPLILWGFRDHTQRHTTVGRTPLDEWSTRRRDLYLTTHNTHNRQTSMPPAGFEPTISAGERPQTYALDRTATGTGTTTGLCYLNRNAYLSRLRRFVRLRWKKLRRTAKRLGELNYEKWNCGVECWRLKKT